MPARPSQLIRVCQCECDLAMLSNRIHFSNEELGTLLGSDVYSYSYSYIWIPSHIVAKDLDKATASNSHFTQRCLHLPKQRTPGTSGSKLFVGEGCVIIHCASIADVRTFTLSPSNSDTRPNPTLTKTSDIPYHQPKRQPRPPSSPQVYFQLAKVLPDARPHPHPHVGHLAPP